MPLHRSNYRLRSTRSDQVRCTKKNPIRHASGDIRERYPKKGEERRTSFGHNTYFSDIPYFIFPQRGDGRQFSPACSPDSTLRDLGSNVSEGVALGALDACGMRRSADIFVSRLFRVAKMDNECWNQGGLLNQVTICLISVVVSLTFLL